MSRTPAKNTTPTEAALLASHASMTSPTKRSVRSRTVPCSCNNTSPPPSSSMPEPQPLPALVPPTTPHRPLTLTTPCAPRKRNMFNYSAKPEPSTMSKPRRGRKKGVIPLDESICIPMEVLRMQKDDTNALLRRPPRPSDQLRKLVDLSVEGTLERLRASGATGMVEVPVWIPRKKNWVETNAATHLTGRARGVRKE